MHFRTERNWGGLRAMTSPLRLYFLFQSSNSLWRCFRQERRSVLLFVLVCMICFHLPATLKACGLARGRAQLALASPENVQCRAVFIQFVRALVSPAQGPASNPFLTHGPVESPAKSSGAVPLRCYWSATAS